MPKGTGSGGTVPFKLQSVRHVPSAGPAYHLLLAQNPDGRLFLSHNGRDSVVLPPEASGVFEWTGDGRVLVMGQGDANDHLGMNSRRVTDVWTDRSGTLFGAFDGSYGRVPMQGVLARLPDETLVKVADVAAMRALGDGTEWGIDSAFSVAPNGDVWMFVKQGLGAPRIGLMERVGEGAWRLREVHPFPQGEVPPPQVLGFGTADPFGGYVFFHDGDLWRFTPDAPARLLAKVDLPLDEGTRITGPVVTPDGHVWLALSPSREVMQWTEAHSPTHRKLMTSVVAGGSSGLVRITPDGQGGSKVAVIPAAALRKELGRVHGETPAKVRIVKLQPDHATGGLAGYDSDGRLHFRLVPER